MQQPETIPVPKWVLSAMISVVLALFFGAFGWCWQLNSVVATLTIEKANKDYVQRIELQLVGFSKDIEYIKEIIDE